MKKKTTPKTPKTVYISVFDIVGDHRCYTLDEGKRVHRRICSALRRGDNVVLSFRNTDSFTTPFLGVAIGDLYEKFSEKQIRKSLKIEDLEQGGMRRIERVIEDTKSYLADPKAYNEALRDATGF